MPGKVGFGISGVRELAQRRVSQTSLRAVADEIGMSNSGLHSFLRGGEPYSSVRKKLVAWFVRAKFPESRPIAAAEIDAAAAVLAAYLRQTGTRSVRERRYLELAERIASEGDVAGGITDGSDASPIRYARKRKRRQSR